MFPETTARKQHQKKKHQYLRSRAKSTVEYQMVRDHKLQELEKSEERRSERLKTEKVSRRKYQKKKWPEEQQKKAAWQAREATRESIESMKEQAYHSRKQE
jgi:hypothetical protein